MLIDDGIKRILYMYDKDSKEWYEHFTFNCQEPGFTPIGTYNGKIVVSGSKFSPNGELVEYNDTNYLLSDILLVPELFDLLNYQNARI